MSEIGFDDVLEGARNLARNSTIQSGDRVLLHAEFRTAPTMVDALRTALEELGAHVSVLTTVRWNVNTDPPPRELEWALEGVDVLVGTGQFLQVLGNLYLKRGIYDRGLLYIHNEASSSEAMGSDYGRFPLELLAAIGEEVVDQITGKTLRITTVAGTDLTLSAMPESIGGYWYPYAWDGPGHKKGFPGGAFCFYPDNVVKGVAVAEALPPDAKAPQIVLDEPLRLTIEDHRVVGMEGDCADWLRDSWAERGDENSGWLGKCMWGIHPKAQSPHGRGGSNPHLMNLGFGNSTQYGGPAYSKTWVRVFMEDPTVVADGEPVVVDGRLTALKSERLLRRTEEMGFDPGLLEQVRERLVGSTDLGGVGGGGK